MLEFSSVPGAPDGRPFDKLHCFLPRLKVLGGQPGREGCRRDAQRGGDLLKLFTVFGSRFQDRIGEKGPCAHVRACVARKHGD